VIRRRFERGAKPSSDVAFYLPSITPLLEGHSSEAPGGAQTQVLLLAKALAARGVRTTLIAYPGAGGLPASVDGVTVIERPASKGHQRLVGKLRETLRVRHALRSADPAVVVCRTAGVYLGVVALTAKLLLRRRFVYAAASLLDFDFDRRRFGARGAFVYRLGFRLADAVVVQTDEQAQLCQETVGRTPVVIRSIAEHVSIRRQRQPDAFLWIGRIYPNKQPLVYAQLASALPEARFEMVAVPSPGSDGLLADIRDVAAATPNLEIFGPMSPAAIAEHVDRAVAVVSTSSFEGMPNVFLEAWAKGVPVIAYQHDPDGVISRFGLGASCNGDLASLVTELGRRWEARHFNDAEKERCRAHMAREHAPEVIAPKWQQLIEGLAREATTARGIIEARAQ
jgi:glycosyltransferase involved in cell wall biosynthesis